MKVRFLLQSRLSSLLLPSSVLHRHAPSSFAWRSFSTNGATTESRGDSAPDAKGTKKSTASALIERELYLDQSVVRLVLNAEKRRNVLTLALMDELCRELREIDGIQKLRAVILAGKGPAFSAGHDLKELTSDAGVTQHKLIFKRCTELMLLIQSMKLPVIAEVDGVAAAAGCQLVASCDVVVASPNAKFMVNGLNAGLFCSTPGIPLARNIPRKLALDMLLTGRAITAEEALRAGLVSRVAPTSADVRPLAIEVAEQICRTSRSVTALGKAFFHAQVDLNNLHHAYRQGEAVMCENLKMMDAQNGIQSFIEKAQPEWTHSDKKIL